MSKIYIPETHGICTIVIDKDTVRDYFTLNINQENQYTDFYINSHYISKKGTELTTSTIDCLDSDIVTNEVYYRNDFADILVIFTILCLFIFLLPIKILFRLFRRFN